MFKVGSTVTGEFRVKKMEIPIYRFGLDIYKDIDVLHACTNIRSEYFKKNLNAVLLTRGDLTVRCSLDSTYP